MGDGAWASAPLATSLLPVLPLISRHSNPVAWALSFRLSAKIATHHPFMRAALRAALRVTWTSHLWMLRSTDHMWCISISFV